MIYQETVSVWAYRISMAFVVIVAVLHALFFAIESIFISSEFVKEIFGADLAENCAVLAVNQGFYNLMLTFGLIWAFVVSRSARNDGTPVEIRFGLQTRVYFFAVVVIVGIVGGATVSPGILMIQMLPGLIGLIATIVEWLKL